MDKGLSIEEARNFISAAHPHIDIIKLGFGTAFVTPNLKEKIDLYQSFDIPVYFGGTLFEAFLIRNQFNDYINICKEFNIKYMEVSDGSIDIPHAEKCGYIEKLTKHGIVLSEVGSKDAAHIIPPYKWIELMKAELEAGASYVIAEAREAGNVGYIPWNRRSKRRSCTGNSYTNSTAKNYLGSTAKSPTVVFFRIDRL